MCVSACTMRSGPEVNGTYLGQQPNQARRVIYSFDSYIHSKVFIIRSVFEKKYLLDPFVYFLLSLTSNNVRRKPMTQETASRVVFFHLETTGFGHDAEIIQITASCYGQTFNAYLLPEGEIHPKV